MIYLENTTSAQTISIPYSVPDMPVHKKVQEVKDYSVSEGGQFVIEPDSGYTSMGKVDLNVDASGIFNSGYTSGYSAGTEAQKAKLTAVTIRENGQYNRPDGYSAVTVNVDESQAYQSGYTEGFRQGEQTGYNAAANAAEMYSVGLIISANGQYNATITEQVKGYISGVSVNVAAVSKLPSIIDDSINEPITAADLSGITKVRTYGFAYLSNVPSIELPNTVTQIGTYAFYNCTSLTRMTIPSGVTLLNSNTFGNCINLEEVIIPEGVVQIESSVFSNCSKLYSLVFPSTLTTLGLQLDSYNGSFGLKNLVLKSPNKVNLNGYYNAAYWPNDVNLWVPYNTLSAYTADSKWTTGIAENNWTINILVDSIGFADVEWVNDVPRSGGIADKDNCTFKVYGYVSGETPVDLTDICNIEGAVYVPAYTGDTRHQVGTLTLTATYSIYSATTQVTIWQSAEYLEVSPTYMYITSDGAGGNVTINSNSPSWSVSGVPSYLVFDKISGTTFPDVVNVGAQTYNQGELRYAPANFVTSGGLSKTLNIYQMPEVFSPYIHLSSLNGTSVNGNNYTTYCVNTGLHATADTKFRIKGRAKGYYQGGLILGYCQGIPGCNSDSTDWRLFWYNLGYISMDINSDRFQVHWQPTDGKEIDYTFNGTTLYDNINEVVVIDNINGSQTPSSPNANIWLSLNSWWFKEVEIEQNNQVVFHGVAVDGGIRNLINNEFFTIPNLVYEN